LGFGGEFLEASDNEIDDVYRESIHIGDFKVPFPSVKVELQVPLVMESLEHLLSAVSGECGGYVSCEEGVSFGFGEDAGA
jgi:hypothetical protein